MQETGKKIKPCVPLPHTLPQVRGAIAVLVGRVPCTALEAEVEGQELRPRPLQVRHHRNVFGVHREMHERPTAK